MKKLRDKAQQTIYKIINPFIKGMVKMGITPNFITATGLVLNIGACFLFIYGSKTSEVGDFTYVGWGGAVILFAGLFDMMDGQLARIGNMSSRYGALFDSVLDRYSELIVLFGICYYLIFQGFFFASLIAFIALIGSMMVSYVRARAEGLGIECKGGFMQRPERVVIIGLGALFCGIFYWIFGNVRYPIYGYEKHPIFEPILILVIPVTIVAIFSNITAIGRMKHCKKVLQELDERDNASK